MLRIKGNTPSPGPANDPASTPVALPPVDPTTDPDGDQDEDTTDAGAEDPDADSDTDGGDADSGKIDPQNAGYQGPEQGPFVCANCQFFEDGHCAVVAGPVDHMGCCNNFSSVSGQSQGPEDQSDTSPDDGSDAAPDDSGAGQPPPIPGA